MNKSHGLGMQPETHPTVGDPANQSLGSSQEELNISPDNT